MNKDFLNPSGLPNWSHSFSQVVVVCGAARTVYVAGQVAVDAEQNLIGGADLGAQARQAFRNLATALAAAGATIADVVKLNIYIKNYQLRDGAIVSAAYHEFFSHVPLPAATWLGVQALAREDFLIEVDAVAVLA